MAGFARALVGSKAEFDKIRFYNGEMAYDPATGILHVAKIPAGGTSGLGAAVLQSSGYESDTFLSLDDTPGAFGAVGEVPVVNATQDKLEFAPQASGAPNTVVTAAPIVANINTDLAASKWVHIKTAGEVTIDGTLQIRSGCILTWGPSTILKHSGFSGPLFSGGGSSRSNFQVGGIGMGRIDMNSRDEEAFDFNGAIHDNALFQQLRIFGIPSSTKAIVDWRGEEMTFRKITIDGGKNLFRCEGKSFAMRAKFDDILLLPDQAGGNVLSFESCDYCEVSGLRIIASVAIGTGINMNCTANTGVLKVISPFIKATGGKGINIAAYRDVQILGARIQDVLTGIDYDAATSSFGRLAIIGGIIENVTGIGVDLDRGLGGVIDGLQVINAGSHGIAVRNRNWKIDAVASECVGDGLRIDTGGGGTPEEISVSGQYNDNGGWGVNEISDASIDDNLFDTIVATGNVSGGVNVTGAGSITGDIK